MKLGKINRQSIGISGFTSILNHYEGMPSELFYRGSLPSTRKPCVAIIGSRKPSAYGIHVTEQLAGELARRGVIILSGLAYGVDAIAHKAALEADGTTIAVLANGLHRVYPAAHAQLAESIIKQGGALISEYPEGVEARNYHFLARNRIISGLADAVIVTEATDKSGTFSTVAHAITQNKDIFAVPGPITSLLSAGPNRLLQDGAHVALSAQDVLDVIAPTIAKQQAQLPLGDTKEEATIISLLQQTPLETDHLARKLRCSVSELLQSLTLMEIKGIIKNTGGQWHLR